MQFGLSPPTRGNLPIADKVAVVYRSIPAHAGEPSHRLGDCDTRGNLPIADKVAVVYRSIPAHAGEPYSPSSRLLGKRVYPSCVWSIPAHAGEPQWESLPAHAVGVYPRPCGGTPNRRILSTGTIA